MNPQTVFNRYDIRGTYPEEIDEGFAKRLGKAAGIYVQQHGRRTVVVGQDTRESSSSVVPAFIQGVRTTGASVVDVGIGTTDRTALATNHYGGIGVMVTASHHAWERTGFKFLYEQGHGFSNDDLADVQDLFETRSFNTGDGALLSAQDEFDETYIDTVTDAFSQHVDQELSGRIVLDSIGGANRTASLIFDELGAEVIEVERDTAPDPEPSAETRDDVAGLLAKTGADLAVGYDPDGDRVYAIHPELGWINGDQLFYLLGHITAADTIVASLDTSPLIETLDADVTYTKVGDVFVSAKGAEIKADLLGEPNGHYAVTDFCWYNTGIFASLLLAAYHNVLPGLLSNIDTYATQRFVKRFDSMAQRDEAMNHVMKNVAKNFEVVSTVDGVKFTGNGFTALARPSGTSPKIRLIVHTEQDAVDPETVWNTVFG